MGYAMKVTFYVRMEDFEAFRNFAWVPCMGTPRDMYMKIKSEMNNVEMKEEKGNRSSTFFVKQREWNRQLL